MAWIVEILDKRVEKEVTALPPDIRADMARIFDLLETHGPDALGMPLIRSLGKGLWEVRAKGKSGIGRGIYVKVAGRRVVVVHAFVKKTQKTPARTLKLAQERAKGIGNG